MDCASPPKPESTSLRSRVVKYALIAGGICAIIGAIEGGVIALIVAQRHQVGELLLAWTLHRGLLFGLGGAGFGVVIGILDWCLARRRKEK